MISRLLRRCGGHIWYVDSFVGEVDEVDEHTWLKRY
jgi:hypothetical protein